MSCNITVSVSDDFAKEAKRLAKKYPSFKQDYKDCLFLNKVDTLKSTLFKKRHSPQALGIKVEYLGSIVTKHIDRVNMATKKLGFSDYSR
jgi:hypothetical protein